MLSSLDTLIAFTVIITIASVLVTLLVQVASFVLSLRGKNLANALALAFDKLAPNLDGQAHALANRILSGQLLSDSTVTEKKAGVATHVTQSEPWHWRAGWRQAAKLANAIRPDEVWEALKRISQEGDQALAGTARKVLEGAATNSPAVKLTEEAMQLAGQMGDAALRDKFHPLLEELSANLGGALHSAKTKFEQLFASAQDRASQWFQTHTRMIAIVASILVAAGLQLDSFEIFSHCGTDDSAKAALVKASEEVLKQTGDALSGNEKAGDQKATEGDPEKFLHKKEKQLADLQQASGAAFDLFPQNGWRWGQQQPTVPIIVGHALGVLLTIGLLTLGAPFWYNLLKNLTGLRPALAQLMGKEKDARDKSSTQPTP